MHVSIIIPCLNEEDTIQFCIEKARRGLQDAGLTGEILVVDNGSADRSAERAVAAGARVIHQPVKGYGAAYLKGIEEAAGGLIIMGDGDDTYDFSRLGLLIDEIRKGADMAIGSRFKGAILKGAMSFSHRYIGNPVLTGILNILFHARISDAHSGFRAIKRDVLEKLNLKTTGMEFASEMIIAALREELKIAEVPVTYYARAGKSKLHPLSDAWRHMRFMLLFSPTWLFMAPGALLFFGGVAALLLSGWGKLTLFSHTFDIHAMIFFLLFSLVGFQIIMLGMFAKAFSVRENFIRDDVLLRRLIYVFDLEKGIIGGGALFLAGLVTLGYITAEWIKADFVGPFNEIKLSLFCLLFMVVGIQIVFSSFFLSLLRLNSRRD